MYICNMITIKTPFSSSRSVHNNIFQDPSTNNCRASYLLLRNKLYEQDENHWSIELKKWLKFRNTFLAKQVVDNKLTCVYCDRDDLVTGYHEFDKINLNNKIKNLATIDHIYPLSKGGAKYDEANCCCSCKKCNNTKGANIL